MSDDDARYLEVFPRWLQTLGEDADQLGPLVDAEGLPEAAREALTGALNYLFKSLDLIPDGIDDIGYLDDAFVLRCACDLAIREDLSSLEEVQVQVLNSLSQDTDVIRGFLGDNFARLESYVSGLRRGAARGRAVHDVLDDEAVRADFLSDVRGFAGAYEAPSFAPEPKNLVKLKAFFDAKLPR